MDKLYIDPTNVAAVADFILALKSPEIDENHKKDWDLHIGYLRESLKAFHQPNHSRKSFIEDVEYHMIDLLENTCLLVQQLKNEIKHRLSIHLQKAS